MGLHYDFVLKSLVQHLFFSMRGCSEASQAVPVGGGEVEGEGAALPLANAYEGQQQEAAVRVGGAAAHYFSILSKRAAALKVKLRTAEETDGE